MSVIWRYDPSSLGDSEGSLETVEFGDWVHNAGTVLDSLGSADNILVGSSMGGWISLWLASQEKFAEKISGLVVIAPALNFIRPHYELTYRGLSQEDRQRLDNGEVGEPPTMFTLLVHNYCWFYCVLSKEKLKTKTSGRSSTSRVARQSSCPSENPSPREVFSTSSTRVRISMWPVLSSFSTEFRTNQFHTRQILIILGSRIKLFLLQNSIEIMNKLKTDNVELVFSKQADHHFSDPNSFLILSSALRKMMSKWTQHKILMSFGAACPLMSISD